MRDDSGDEAACDAPIDTQSGARLDEPTARSVRSTCDQCGAPLRWDPATDALHCEHCGTSRSVPRVDDAIVERPLAAAGDAARGLGLAVRVVRCDECGARLTLDEAATAETCAYCGSSSVLVQDERRNALRPESLVPLDVAREDVARTFATWLRKLWFRPNALVRTKSFEAVGIYVPFWTFDARVHSAWTADAGYHYSEDESYTTHENGRLVTRTRRVQKTRWQSAWGSRDDTYDDLLVPASKGLSDALLAELGGFDTDALVPYRPEYLLGWRAEEYQVDLADGWEIGKARIDALQRERCSHDVPGDTQRDLRVRTTIDDVRWKHVLLPVWSLTYRYGERRYAVLVNGQTGRIVGKAPWSWIKIACAALGVAAAGFAAAAWSSMR